MDRDDDLRGYDTDQSLVISPAVEGLREQHVGMDVHGRIHAGVRQKARSPGRYVIGASEIHAVIVSLKGRFEHTGQTAGFIPGDRGMLRSEHFYLGIAATQLIARPHGLYPVSWYPERCEQCSRVG